MPPSARAHGISRTRRLVVTGLGFAPIYPSVIHSTPDHFGRDKSQAVIGVQMASAYVGSTFAPLLFGLLSEALGHRRAARLAPGVRGADGSPCSNGRSARSPRAGPPRAGGGRFRKTSRERTEKRNKNFSNGDIINYRAGRFLFSARRKKFPAERMTNAAEWCIMEESIFAERSFPRKSKSF